MAAVPCKIGRPGVEAQMAEMVALNELSTQRPLSSEESERLGRLIYREQQRARYRPARIQRLKAELALLESLELADRGAIALAECDDREIEAVRDCNGHWSARERQAA